MTDLTLHIGTPKTGTTTVQQWFSKARPDLLAQGIRYPRVFGAINHQKLMIYARDSKFEAAFYRHGVHNVEEHHAFRATLTGALDRELADFPNVRHWIVSNEHLYSKLGTAGMLTRLKDLLAPRFTAIRVVVHLRPQVDMVVSNTSQRARLGKEVSRAALTRPAIGPQSRYFNYDTAVALWEEVFGAESIEVVPFRRIPAMTEHLAARAGIDLAPLPPIERKNEALGWRTMALANQIRRPLLDAGEAGLNHDREIFINALPGSEPLQIGTEIAREIQGRFADTNAALIARRPELEDGDLDPDWARYDAPPNIEALDAPCPFTDQLSDMVRRFNRALRAEELARHLAEARLARAENRPKALEQSLMRARRLSATLDGAEAETIAALAGEARP